MIYVLCVCALTCSNLTEIPFRRERLGGLLAEKLLKMKNLPSLKLTWPLKINGWKMNFLLGRLIFRGYVSFREGNL